MQNTKKLWGGRFKKAIDKEFFEFQKSIGYDYKLAEYDIYHSIIHVQALTSSGMLTKPEEEKMLSALRSILSDVKHGKFVPDAGAEDIHSDIQNRIENKLGDLALKLHTLRSRNDQVVFDEKLYILDQYIEMTHLLSNLLEVFSDKSQEYKSRYFVGYTHTQRAQVICFSDYILAYGRMFMRDYNRLAHFEDNLTVAAGSGALAGTPIDAQHYQRAISLGGMVKKHLDAMVCPMDHVASRDFIVEFLSVLSIIQMHLSRLAEDMIMYSTREFDFVDIPEEFCTGSSLMPHKKNADFLELVRGYTGRVYGNLVSVLTMLKGLPLSYNRDMQLDKEPLFSSVDIVKSEIKIMSRLIKGIKLKKESIDRALRDEGLYATEIAQYLVIKHKVAFKEAHDIAGKLIRHSEDTGCAIKSMTDKALASFHKGLSNKDLLKVMTPQYAVKSKRNVRHQFPRPKLG